MTINKTVLELVEERLQVLTKRVAEQEDKVRQLEVSLHHAQPHKKPLARGRVRAAYIDLFALRGRQEEAESIWNLLRVHKGEVLT